MSANHFIERCRHGVVMRQCRCIGPKAERIVECTHSDAAMADLPDVNGDFSFAAIRERDEQTLSEYFPNGRPRSPGAAYDRHLLISYIDSVAGLRRG